MKRLTNMENGQGMQGADTSRHRQGKKLLFLLLTGAAGIYPYRLVAISRVTAPIRDFFRVWLLVARGNEPLIEGNRN